YLCRGRAASLHCSKKAEHPFFRFWRERGAQVRGKELKEGIESMQQTFVTKPREFQKVYR
ncbi:MAG: hypothetical protein KDD44_11395, partial [Bdellovibrionales bacterium]|nr:hypothetical protein [Bdellovibrionales bacterium]